MPMLTFMESFMMIGLLTNDKHYLNDFYYNTFNSNLDVMNLIRMGFSPEKDPNTLEILSRYGLSNLVFFNISGEIFLLLIVLAITLILKGLLICFKIEKLRYASTKLRPIWNGLIFYLLPRILTFSGYQFRSFTDSTSPVIINGILASLLVIGYIVFFAMLISQTKKINSRYDYLEDSIFEIGLARRYDYNAEF